MSDVKRSNSVWICLSNFDLSDLTHLYYLNHFFLLKITDKKEIDEFLGQTSLEVALKTSHVRPLLKKEILLDRINRMLGVGGAALNWLRQYHVGRKQVIIIGSNASSHITLDFGAPQGSVMGSEDYPPGRAYH